MSHDSMPADLPAFKAIDFLSAPTTKRVQTGYR